MALFQLDSIVDRDENFHLPLMDFDHDKVEQVKDTGVVLSEDALETTTSLR